MAESVRDIQHVLHADGRKYVIEVCAAGRNPPPILAGPFDVHIMAEAPEGFAEHDADEPEVVVRHVMDYVRPLVPTSVSVDEWCGFADAVLMWVCAHRDGPSRHRLSST